MWWRGWGTGWTEEKEQTDLNPRDLSLVLGLLERPPCSDVEVLQI